MNSNWDTITTSTTSVHVSDWDREGASVIHWNRGVEDRYSLTIASVTFFFTGEDFRNKFLPELQEATANPITQKKNPDSV
jgi:hypothetical protein